MQRKFPIWLIIVFVLIIGALVISLLEQAPNEQQDQKDPAQAEKTKFQPAADFTLTDLEGNTVSLSDYRGKNVYLNFWASWCGPCKIEMPDIEKFHQEYKDKDWVILAVDVGEDPATVKDFITTHHYSFPVLLDTKGAISKDYKVASIPFSFFINKEGELVSKKKGIMSFSEMQAYASKL